jgi:transposase
MALLHLSARARQILQRLARSNADAREVRRAPILLWLNAHQTVQEIAQRLGRTRQAIYALVQRYHARHAMPVAARIRDEPRSGRPATKGERTLQVIQTLLAQPPSRYHDRAPVWTVPMLRTQVQRRLKCSVHTRTVRRCFHRLRYRFKRPRYVFAQRPATWRQAKGG